MRKAKQRENLEGKAKIRKVLSLCPTWHVGLFMPSTELTIVPHFQRGCLLLWICSGCSMWTHFLNKWANCKNGLYGKYITSFIHKKRLHQMCSVVSGNLVHFNWQINYTLNRCTLRSSCFILFDFWFLWQFPKLTLFFFIFPYPFWNNVKIFRMLFRNLRSLL